MFRAFVASVISLGFLSDCVPANQHAAEYDISVSSYWTESEAIELHIFLNQRTSERSEFSLLFGPEIFCTESDGNKVVVPVTKKDEWGNIEFAVQHGLQMRDIWQHRSVVLVPRRNVSNLSCFGSVWLETDSREQGNSQEISFEVSLKKDKLYSNDFKLEESVVDITFELDRFSNHGRGFLKFVFQNEFAKSISIVPLSKHISCLPGSSANEQALVWEIYGPSPRGAMHRIYIPAGELGALTDVVKILDEDAWRDCRAIYEFGDGQSSTMTYEIDFQKVPTGFVDKSN